MGGKSGYIGVSLKLILIYSMRNFLFTWFLLLPFASLVIGQDQIQWLTWEQALEKNKIEKRKIIVDVYTQWCTWCKKMDQRTYRRPEIVEQINQEFYAIKFDAEQKEDIIFNNKIYKYVSTFGMKGYHELAQEIMNGRMSYPTTVFIDEDLNVIQPIPGFQGSITFKMILDYFSGNFYTHTPWHKFEKGYQQKNAITPKAIQPTVQPVNNN